MVDGGIFCELLVGAAVKEVVLEGSFNVNVFLQDEGAEVFISFEYDKVVGLA